MAERLINPGFQKFSPIDQEYPIFELLVGDTILFDVGATDDGVVDVCMHEGSRDVVFDYDELVELLAEGRRLVEEKMKAR